MDLIKEINDKYLALEAEVDKKLEKVQAEELKLERQTEKLTKKCTHSQSPKVLSYEEALLRNTNTLKSLEIAKARLRSRSTYSPCEKLLQQAIENYKKELKTAQDENLPKKMPKDSKQDSNNYENVDDDDTDNLYELVMQNVIEASSKGSLTQHTNLQDNCRQY